MHRVYLLLDKIIRKEVYHLFVTQSIFFRHTKLNGNVCVTHPMDWRQFIKSIAIPNC